MQIRRKTKSYASPIQDKYLWTMHSHDKMREYNLSEPRVKRIIRHPTRVEKSIIEDEQIVAAMQPAMGKHYAEIWVIYKIEKLKVKSSELKVKKDFIENAAYQKLMQQIGGKGQGKIKIITAWRYPGKSPERDPIPEDILSEIRSILQ